jgi:transcriptional antiterminator NusG
MAKRWYIIHAYSNFENKVAVSIREQVKHRGLEHLFEEIIVPTEKVVEVRHGQKHATERKFFPGYVLTKVELTNEAYHLIRNTPKVAGFLGSHKKPIPISDTEAAHVLQQIQEGIERPKPLVSFEVGDQVQVSDGPFSSFNATVEEIDETRSRLKVAVSIFGRPTPFSQVGKPGKFPSAEDLPASLSVAIDAGLWDRLRPSVMELCGYLCAALGIGRDEISGLI